MTALKRLKVTLETGFDKLLKGLILAQNERWRRGLGMQVEREPSLTLSSPSPHAPLPQGEGCGVRGEGGVRGGESGERGSKAWVTYPPDRDSHGKLWVIPGDVAESHGSATKGPPPGERLTCY